MASNTPDASIIHAVLGTHRKWCWKQRVVACYLSGVNQSVLPGSSLKIIIAIEAMP
jgi:hypothetical protein